MTSLENSASVTAVLTRRYPTVSLTLLRSLVDAEFDRHRHARIQIFLPVLVQREVETLIQRMAKEDGLDLTAGRPDMAPDEARRGNPAGRPANTGLPSQH